MTSESVDFPVTGPAEAGAEPQTRPPQNSLLSNDFSARQATRSSAASRGVSAVPPAIPRQVETVASRHQRLRTASRQSTSPLVPLAAALTLAAFVVALGRLFVVGGEQLDWMSPPFAIVGGILTAIVNIRHLRPRKLAMSALLLNGAYWLYFVLILLSA